MPNLKFTIIKPNNMKDCFNFLIIFIPVIGLCQQALLIPDTISGNNISLSLNAGEVEFMEGNLTQTLGYNQEILGPTIFLKQNKMVQFDVINNLEEATTLHWHGLHVSAENDGGPHTIINAGETWSPSFTVLDKAATYWYHPHLHEHTEKQVTLGASGFIIVNDDEESLLNLPRSYGEDDFPIVIQSRSFSSTNQFQTQTSDDNKILVNATLNPYLEVPAQVVRFRLLNGSTERVYNLGLSDASSFFQIGTDGGLLDKPVELNRLILSPGERAEILLNLTDKEGDEIDLVSFNEALQNGIYGAENASAMPMGSITGYNENELNGSNFNILHLKIEQSLPNPVFSIPSSLIENTPYSEMDVDHSRSMSFQPKQMGPNGMVNGPFLINNASFDLDFINETIPLNNIEIWELTNSTAIAHPFHIHDVQFYILEINGSPPPNNLKGRKDVILVPPMFGSVKFITKFEDFANKDIPYMYHCHMLSHEDEGMMGQFIVEDISASVVSSASEYFNIYPNPTRDILQINNLPRSDPYTVEIYNPLGQLIFPGSNLVGKNELDVSHFLPGQYFMYIKQNQKIIIQSFIKQ